MLPDGGQRIAAAEGDPGDRTTDDADRSAELERGADTGNVGVEVRLHVGRIDRRRDLVERRRADGVSTSWNAATARLASSAGRPATDAADRSPGPPRATIAVTSTIPTRVPTEIDASFRAAAVAGSPRGTLAKMIAVRTVVAMTNPAPTSSNGTRKAR